MVVYFVSLLAIMLSVAWALSAPMVSLNQTGTTLPNSKRLVGYLEDWVSIPQQSVLSQYSHVMYAFIESSSRKCQLSEPDQVSIDKAHQAGAKVIGSIGGWSMNRYWQYCTTESLTNQLVAIVNKYGLDGIDIDYEVSPLDSDFVVTLHNSLRELLPTSILTHAPMNCWMGTDGVYWNILKRCNGVDFVNVQYYNNEPNPVSDPDSAIAHYSNIVNGLFAGDATKVVFGLCINDCNSYNANAQISAKITESLVSKYGNQFGGVMDWAINNGDSDGSWSNAVLSSMNA